MRPLELTIEGFNSYRDAATFSFDGRTLFGIVGPTGSGKSSILDAMLYALYGKTPRIERSTKMLVNSSEEMARIVLLFEASGGVWEVTRVLRKKSQSQVVLRKSDDSVPVVSGEANVNAAIEDLIGLDFRAFLSTVSLPQGEFDKFLHSATSDRSRILKGIFRLDRVDKIREVAKRRQAGLDGKISALSQQAAALPSDPETEILARQTALAEATALQEEAKLALPAVLKLESDTERSQEELARLSERRDEVQALLSTIPDPDGLQEDADIAEAALETFNASESLLAAASKALDDAATAMEEAERATGGKDWILEAASLIEQKERLDRSITSLMAEAKSNDELLSDAKKAQADAAAYLAEAVSAVAAAQSELDELNAAHAAHLLRDHLEQGQPCPVCEQRVATLPAKVKIAGSSKAEAALTKAKKVETAARDNLTKADVTLGVTTERSVVMASSLSETKAEHDATEQRLNALFPPGVDPLKELEQRRAGLAAAAEALNKSRSDRDAAERQERAARQSMDETKKRLESVVRSLMKACGALRVPFDPDDPYGRLPGIAKQAREAGLGELDSVADKASALEGMKEKSLAAIAEFRARFGAATSESVSDVIARLSQDVVGISSDVDRLKEAILRREETKKQIADLGTQKALLDRVTTDFTDSRFTKFLLDGQRRLLSRIGSEKLVELTTHYRFDEDGEFNIIDTRSGISRHPDTLSGGETFLASLALALALAEAVSLQGGQLGCFFLDEGFGSLDAESLDLALEGIETLATPGRVIGLISHVFSIQSRLDDLIVLEKDSEGATVVVQDGGPIGYMAPMI